MSVINDMLRDLEARKAPERSAPVEAEVHQLIEPQRPAVPWLKFGILAVAGLLMVSSIYFVLLQSPDSFEEVSQQEPALHATVAEEQGEEEPNTQTTQDVPQASFKEAPQESETNEPASVASTPPERATTSNESKQTVAHQKRKTKDLAPKVTLADLPRNNVIKPEPEVKQTAARTVEVVSKKDTKTSVSATIRPQAELTPKLALSPETLDQNNAALAIDLFKQDKPREAYRTLYRFIEANEIDQKSRASLATFLMRDQRLAEAGDVLVSLPVEQKAEWRQIKARWLAATGKPDLAIYTLNMKLPELAEKPDYFELLASFYQQQGYAEKAAQLYRALVEFDSTRANWWAGLAIALDRSKQFQDAQQAYRQALALPGLRTELISFVRQREQQLGKSLNRS